MVVEARFDSAGVDHPGLIHHPAGRAGKEGAGCRAPTLQTSQVPKRTTSAARRHGAMVAAQNFTGGGRWFSSVVAKVAIGLAP